MTSQEVKAITRQSLGLPPLEEIKPTIPVEGHVCDFPLWSFSKQRSSEKKLHRACRGMEVGGISQRFQPKEPQVLVLG